MIALRYVIWSKEHRAWWRTGSRGYTTHVEFAGSFDEDQARQIVRDANIAGIEDYAVIDPRQVISDEVLAELAARPFGKPAAIIIM